MNIRHMMATGIDSPVWDRALLTVGRTAADDLAEFQASGGESAEVSDEGTLKDDIKDFDFEEGYHDEMPETLLEEEAETSHDWQKRHHDTRAALDKERAEKLALQSQLTTLQQQRQPIQPNVIQPGQVDPLAQIDQEYTSHKERLKAQTMNEIRGLKRDDPMIQDKIADAWARHSEQVVELASSVRERKQQYQSQQQQDAQVYRDRLAEQALVRAGYSKDDREAFIERVAILNFKQPGWDRGMQDVETYDFVVQQMRQGGHVSTQPESLTPRQQHEALRSSGKSALKPGARQDPQKPQKKALPEEKDVSFYDQLRQAKRKRMVTDDQARRLKMR